MDSLKQAMQQKMNIRFVTWITRSFYRSGSLKSAAREFKKNKSDLMEV
jgi:hypothetical protein